MADLYYYETAANVPFNGVAGSTVYTDYSYRHSAVANVGAGPSLTASNPKFAGTTSLLLASGSTTDYVTVPMVANTLNVGTVEFHVLFTSLTGAQGVFSLLGASGQQLFVYKDASNVFFYGQGTGAGDSTGTTAAVNTWYHIALNSYLTDGGLTRTQMYINGVAKIPYDITFTNPYNAVTSASIGAATVAGTSNTLLGQIANLRITPGVARYVENTNFTPPTAPYDIGSLPINLITPNAGPMFHSIPAGIMPAVNAVYAQIALKIRDYSYGGTGMISGTTAIKSLPDNTLVSRKVRLYNERDGNLIAEQWSDAVTGAYTFNNLSMTLNYTVIAYDTPHNFRAVVADNLTPDPMP